MAFVGAFILLMVVVGGVGLVAAMVMVAHIAVKAAREPTLGGKRRVCEACGYPGQGLEGRRCPECGGVFIEIAAREQRHRRSAIDSARGLGLALLVVASLFGIALLLGWAG